MNIDYIKKLIVKLGFAPQDGRNGIFVKRYANHNNYPIFLDFNEQKIEYAHHSIQADKSIRLGDLTTSNFEKPENFVVLECVDRLLTKGYRPDRLELEKKYPLGRNLKGKLDILVYDENDDAPFLMIECKTWGSEYEKESAKTLKDGGQIFSYYQQDRAAKFLCLYASHLDRKEIEYRNNIVLVKESWRDLSSAKDIYDYWNKNFKDNGVFEVYATPYDIKPKALTYGMLKNLKEEDSGKIYNQIMEILRHNAISDKPNAFNKLLNLFVCKIIDENQNPDDELGFQWLETDTDESLQMRLNDLYKEGMWRFLAIKVIDHSEEDVTKALEGIDDDIQKQRLMDMFMDARLKKSPNFAFIEVLDEKTFKLNAKIVREIVELLQVYKFRYQQKHEFLGNFFELLLNTSMKQEAGQFFTPVPITRFIISSLPLKEFVQSKIDSRARDILPVVMDYACGSGHFLTEYMDQMQTVIDSKIDVETAAPNIRNLIKTWRDTIKFAWAKDFVYGIDLDNRLVKTAKVSAFFNGDGEANIIWANGLDNFEKTEEYRNLLRQTQPYDRKNNGQFDILISNPPYSVEAFKSTLKYGEETFELYNNITDNSSEIECLFVERMKQLLKVGGWAGVILPSSILSNGGVHSKAREILFKYFKVKAIVELGSGTFMKTGTNTVVLFLERRSDNDFVTIEKAINTYVSNLKDVTVLGIENAFSKYVANVYDDIAFDDYLSFIGGNANETMQMHELYLDYSKAFGDDVYAKAITLEKEKMFYFLLTYSQNVVLVKTGQKQDEKKFLGYEFSERRGHEGIKHLPNGTKLFDKSGDLMNPQRANSYIYNAFLGKVVSVDESLAHNVSYGRMSGFINYGTNKFDKTINVKSKVRDVIESQYPYVKLGDGIVEVLDSMRKPVSRINRNKGDYPYYGATGIVDYVDDYIFDGQYVLIGEDGAKWGASEDSAFLIKGKCWINNHAHVLKPNSDIILDTYLVSVLNKMDLSYYITGEVNVPKLNQSNLLSIKFPIPPLDVQKQIVAEIERIEGQIQQSDRRISELRQQIESIYNYSDNDSIQTHLGQIVECNPSKSELANVSDDTVISFIEMASIGNNGHIITAVDRPLADVRKGSYTYFRENDIIVAKITPCMENGKCALAINLSNNIGMGSSEFHVFRCNNAVIPRYLFGFLNRHVIREEAEKRMTGASGHRRVPISFYEQLTIHLPFLNRQQEIVAEIERIEVEIKAIQVKLIELKIEKDGVLQRYL
ncbi:MAG: restriction endonuclease subunit S [Eubacteriales bacterium]|nr:restriction endonuclease subunit S [Eubacteriales bacterium]